MKKSLSPFNLALSPKWIERSAFGFNLLRSANYTGQFLLLPLVEKWATGATKIKPDQFPQKMKEAYSEILELYKEDSKNIGLGLYPADVLKPESPVAHAKTLFSVLKDGFEIARRRKEKSAHEFSVEDQENLSEIPEYARRNYHFQTGGYASLESAELYEHQVEMLFSGSADAMRRIMIAPLKQATGWGDGEGLKFLEIGAGTGRLTGFMKQAFPKARIVATDMSAAYLQKARSNLSNFEKIDFLQALGEDLPLPDRSFDLVYSCFLFHELPREIRKKVISESKRVLKTDGFMAINDSLQKNDNPKLNWALEIFPQDFHEPFYKNFQNHPLEQEIDELGFKVVDKKVGFLSKALIAVPLGPKKAKA